MTSVDLPTDLIEEAKRATGQTTIRGAITVALEDMVRRQRQIDTVRALSQMECLGEWLKPEVRESARRLPW
jgi:hypothetical protein